MITAKLFAENVESSLIWWNSTKLDAGGKLAGMAVEIAENYEDV